MRPVRFLLVCGVVLAFACSDSDSGPTTIVDPPVTPAPLPTIEAAPGFGDGPLEGFLSLQPSDTVAAWSYRIDLDEDGLPDQEGELARPIAFAYRFAEPGLHLLRVILEGPAEQREEKRLPVIVNDPAAVRVLRETTVPPADPDDPGIFEGITVGPEGLFLYVGEFRGDAISRLDASTLEVVDALGDLGRRGIEGLSVTPSGRFLVANFKRAALLVVELPAMETLRFFDFGVGADFYVQALDDRRAVLGRNAFTVTDFVTGEFLRRYSPPDDEFFLTRHFDVAPNSEFVALAANGDHTIDIVALPQLERMRTLELPPVVGQANLLSFDSTGRKLYVLVGGGRSGPDRFLALDADSGEVRNEVVLDSGGCFTLCVANPTARSRDGRYVAFETDRGVLFVDTATDLPAFRSASHGSVAASPVENMFFALSSSGRVRILEVVQ